MLRFDFLSVKTTVILVCNKIPSVFRTWKNCKFVCKNKLNYFVLKFQFWETLLFNKFLVINNSCLIHVCWLFFTKTDCWLGSCQWVKSFRSNSIPKDFPYPGVTFLRPAHPLPPPPPPQGGKLTSRKKNIITAVFGVCFSVSSRW